MRYYYKDWDRKGKLKIRYTQAPFGGWTEPGGLLNVPYAIFLRRCETILIPRSNLTKETRAVLPQPGKEAPQ